MNSFSIGAERALINGEIISASIEISHGIITKVVPRPAELVGDILLRESDCVLSPGFIDCQINGISDINFFDADKEELERALVALAHNGVTSCTPSMISAPIGELVAAIDASDCGESSPSAALRARHLGYHIEGPFLSDDFSRAHDGRFFLDPTPQHLDPLLETGRVSIITLAPERAHALNAISAISEAGVIASAGHSGATFAQMVDAVAAGLSMVTHLFNGMDKDKNGGILRAASELRELTVGFIADGIHNQSEQVKWAFETMSDRISLVTDALGSMLGDQPVQVDPHGSGGAYRGDGTLAGSTLTLDKVISRAVALGAPLEAALTSATRTPARLLGRSDLGEIKEGALADLTYFSNSGSIRTWIGGVEVAQ